jgi:UDP-GlcNAc:undecaprenyl-phosphate/decaprenyl-phosphate GlcNAc-1-phosphate transferase
MILPILGLGVVSFILSWILTFAMIRIAPRVGFVDKPGHRKIHHNPKPLGGGVAIFWSIALPMLIGLLIIAISDTAGRQTAIGHGPLQDRDGLPHYREVTVLGVTVERALVTGALQQVPLAMTMLAAMLVLHVMGLVDDRRALGPFIKLAVQLLVAAALVLPFVQMRVLTALGPGVSIPLTIVWITAITNAFNFLDNMDGLSAGVAAVCATAFLVTALYIEQWFVAATLALLLGALLGFLWFNFAPAKIFMGDSGSLLIGFVLGVLTVRTTYLAPHEEFAAGWYAVFAPVIVLALPLYDLIVVSIIRISRGKSPFVGDTNHFSHRLVARGMSRRTAVLCIYLVTAATAIAAGILPLVHSTFAAMLIFAQTILILCMVALLEQHPLPRSELEAGERG